MKKLFGILFLINLLSCKPKSESPVSNPLPTAGVMCALKPTDAEWYQKDNKAPIFDGLGNLHYQITTQSSEAQKYFNQGLILSYAFNHAEAARSFYYAAKLDSTCAMCYWGFAYVLGPNYNAGMEPDNYERAYDAVQKAIANSGVATQKEQDMIHALARRYVQEPAEDRSHLDSAYSQAMKELHLKYSDDPEIAALYAESVMDLHPWDLWDKAGQPKPWTPEIIAILEKLLKTYPEHPGVNHFYIHAVEASFDPHRGLLSAKRFDDGMIPAAGHLVHMPSHIYIRTGDYHLGSLSNIKAVQVDSHYVGACNAQGVYPLAYFPHNFHFLAATATMEGNKAWAVMAAQKVSDHSDLELMKDPAWSTLQHYYVIPYFVRIKFGDWDSILVMQNADTSLIYPEAIRHYARGFAYLGKNDQGKARHELQRLQELSKDTSLEKMTIWNINNIKDIVEIAVEVLQAEILASEGNHNESIRLLKEAVNMEDKLNYNEPPDWFFSIRHHLGAVLLEAGKYDEAIAVYKKDLSWWPKNGWSLAGLKVAYEKKKDAKSLAQIEKEFQESWAHSDMRLETSRIK